MRVSTSKQSISATGLLRIFCATLMLSLGFAHKPMVAVGAPSMAFEEAYRLPDGSFAEICEGHAGLEAATHGKSNTDHSGMPSLFCEACLLASSILLPTPDMNSWMRAHFAWLDNRPARYVSLAHHVDDQPAKARAPPIIL